MRRSTCVSPSATAGTNGSINKSKATQRGDQIVMFGSLRSEFGPTAAVRCRMAPLTGLVGVTGFSLRPDYSLRSASTREADGASCSNPPNDPAAFIDQEIRGPRVTPVL